VRLVASLAELYPVRPLLRALKLAPSTYYYRRGRPDRPDRYKDVRPLLRESFATAYRAYGYRRLRMQLRIEHGVAVSGKTVRRLMREEGCTCVVRRRKRRQPAGRAPHPANVFAPNLLNRDFAATEPNQKWVTDVTQFTAAGELLFLSPLIDLFNGEVLSYRLDTNQGMPVVLGMLRDALPRARRGITTLHSDRGWQYQHAGFRGALRSAGISQSMSRSGNCYDNACAENFFSHFKQEFLRGRHFDSVEEFTDQLAGWITWFNTARLSEKRGWTSPRGYSTT
jgi:putative transposase